MFKRLKNFIKFKSSQINSIDTIARSLVNMKSPKINLGQIQSYLNNQRTDIKSLNETEFQVFSQFGDDGIIQYLINKIEIPNKTFVEFGVENYIESNTRFLLINNKWHGLVIDGSDKNIQFIEKDQVSLMHHLYSCCAFITKENINEIIQNEFLSKGYDPEIGILSIDIDGVDYWVWDAINCINPVIVIIEYNSVFGETAKYTVPYKPDFVRMTEHTSYQYWGASLNAFCHLGTIKGYEFIGCNSNGNNAYFVKKDKNIMRSLSSAEGFVEAQFREYVDNAGKRWGGKERINLIKGMPIYNIEKNGIDKL